MKKWILIICICLFIVPVFGQSFLKTGTNLSTLTSCTFCLKEGFKSGLTIGHQIYLLQFKDLKVIFGDAIDYKRMSYNYYKGGKGAGTTNRGNFNQVNLELDLRLRLGKKLFTEFGSFTSYSFLKKFDHQKSSYSQGCLFPPPIGICPPVTNQPVPFEDEFKRFELGILLGIGYQYEKIILMLDYQGGILPILIASNPLIYLTGQFNFNIAIPFSELKKK